MAPLASLPDPRDTAVVYRFDSSPKAQIQSAPLRAVRWTEGYWAERWKQALETTAPRLWNLLADPAEGHVLENLRIAAGLVQGKYKGTTWQDEWVYKWIEAAAALYAVSGEEWLDRRMDEAIAIIAQAQEADGYIASQIAATDKQRFSEPRDHEIYNMGHLITAGVVHKRVTGKDSLFQVARRAADFLCETVGVTVEPYFAHNPSALMGLAELYRETGERKYLDCAQRIVDARGTKPRRNSMFSATPGIDGTDQIQDRTPLRESKEVVGHNVFFTYLFTGAADIYLETGEPALLAALQRLWRDLTERKINVNGGVSPMGVGLSNGHFVNEAVGPAYFLPNAASYNETCGQIGFFMWSHRLLCAAGGDGAAFADWMEWTIHNGVMSGMGLDGQSWYYRNPLRREAGYRAAGHNDMSQRESPGAARICCPSNMIRTIAELHTYFYGISPGGVWLNLYGASEFAHQWEPGDEIAIEQKTDYPWDGRIEIEIRKAPARPIFIQARIPSWAKGARIEINGQPAEAAAAPGAYARIERAWKPGDRIALDFPMQPRLLQGHPKAEHIRNQAAVARGPILYCLEAPDLPRGRELHNVYLPLNPQFQPTAAADMPFGIRALEGKALYRAEAAWADDLYRPIEEAPFEPMPLRLIPYFAWANRGEQAMSVWLPLAWREA